jgi:uncharacterized protein (TIGR00369 family)
MCFICGRQNPVGLKLRFYEDHEARQIKADLTIPDEYQGYPGVVHGGIVSAVLDEVSGRAVMMEGEDDLLLATLRMTVRFRRPTPTESPLTAVGWVERMSGVGAKVAGEIRLADGTVTADCSCLLVEPPAEFREMWQDEIPYWKVDEE